METVAKQKEAEEETSNKKQNKITQVVILDSDAAVSSASESQESRRWSAEILYYKVKEQNHDYMDSNSTVMDLHATKFAGVHKRKCGKYGAAIKDPIKKKKVKLGSFKTAQPVKANQGSSKSKSSASATAQLMQKIPSSLLKPQGSNSTNTTSAAERNGKNPFIREIREDPFQEKQGTRRSPSDGCNSNTVTTSNTKAKISLHGIRRQKNGKYGAVIRDPIRLKQIWLGTFDTVEEASEAYFSYKSEFDKLCQLGNKENKPKDCGQIQHESPVGASSSLDTASVGRNKRHKTTHIIGVHKNKWGKYTSEITNPITKKKIWLGTFHTAEEASRAYQSKKLEFQKLVNAKEPQSTNKNTHSKQHGKKKLVNGKQGHVNCEAFQSGQRIDSCEQSHSISMTRNLLGTSLDTAEEAFHAYHPFKEFNFQCSTKCELQSNVPTDSSGGEKKLEGQVDEDLWMGQWVQLTGGSEVKFSLKLGLPIIDNYGSLLGEFSCLDDLSICYTDDECFA
ncbi:PREDICTED: uncharacterized protein LOC109218168 [Nicotiana attenuata]|uniref:Ethylene-responsive transcription factor erf118 n=1 Tax=Nicotiana attenuata TaxID=49451 RepID=A0A1J6KGR3_NICAT|nr:PREDICTED: uncharacterized protein LOC109218168 [Nicotiana attenuata]OIT21995.1 ethylene-responsive transcription factor erf118 [Nicotiana attenuata]